MQVNEPWTLRGSRARDLLLGAGRVRVDVGLDQSLQGHARQLLADHAVDDELEAVGLVAAAAVLAGDRGQQARDERAQTRGVGGVDAEVLAQQGDERAGVGEGVDREAADLAAVGRERAGQGELGTGAQRVIRLGKGRGVYRIEWARAPPR